MIGLQILPYSLFHMDNVHTPQWFGSFTKSEIVHLEQMVLLELEECPVRITRHPPGPPGGAALPPHQRPHRGRGDVRRLLASSQSGAGIVIT